MSTALGKTALLAVANGSEDIETVTTLDVLRRAGIKVDVASVEEGKNVVLARGTKLEADYALAELPLDGYDAIVCPGGMPGASRLSATAPLIAALIAQKASGKIIAAICAAPAVVFKAHGLIGPGDPATCYPSFVKDLENKDKVDQQVVVTDNVITSQGPGTTIPFALTIISSLCGADSAATVAKGLLVTWP